MTRGSRGPGSVGTSGCWDQLAGAVLCTQAPGTGPLAFLRISVSFLSAGIVPAWREPTRSALCACDFLLLTLGLSGWPAVQGVRTPGGVSPEQTQKVRHPTQNSSFNCCRRPSLYKKNNTSYGEILFFVYRLKHRLIVYRGII